MQKKNFVKSLEKKLADWAIPIPITLNPESRTPQKNPQFSTVSAAVWTPGRVILAPIFIFLFF